MAIEQFNAKKIITKPKTKILMTSIVATILITGMIFMSSPQVFAGNGNGNFIICHSTTHDGQAPWTIETPSEMGWIKSHQPKGDLLIDDHMGGGVLTEIECLLMNQGDPFDGFKTWTHTDYNWEYCPGEVNPEDHRCYNITEPPFTSEIPFETANINNPVHDVLADSLDPPTEDGISDVLLQVNRNGEISNMNPGAIYALTTVNLLANLDMLQVVENYAECTDVELELLNQNNPSRNVKVAVADPNGDVTEVTDILYDTGDDGVEFIGDPDNNSATVKINDASLLTNGSTVFVLVKFDDKLKGVEYDSINGGDPFTCLNNETVSSSIGAGNPFELIFNAELRFTEA